MIVVAKALGELQGTYKALKDNETEKQNENFRLYQVTSELRK